MSVPEELLRTVRARARGRCQYCLMHESLQGATFHVEHLNHSRRQRIREVEEAFDLYPPAH